MWVPIAYSVQLIPAPTASFQVISPSTPSIGLQRRNQFSTQVHLQGIQVAPSPSQGAPNKSGAWCIQGIPGKLPGSLSPCHFQRPGSGHHCQFLLSLSPWPELYKELPMTESLLNTRLQAGCFPCIVSNHHCTPCSQGTSPHFIIGKTQAQRGDMTCLTTHIW